MRAWAVHRRRRSCATASRGAPGRSRRAVVACCAACAMAIVLPGCRAGAGARAHALARVPIEGQSIGSALGAEPAPSPGPPSGLDAISPEVASAFGIVLVRHTPASKTPTAEAWHAIAGSEGVPPDRVPPSPHAIALPPMATEPSEAVGGTLTFRSMGGPVTGVYDTLHRGFADRRHPRGAIGLAGSLLPNVGVKAFGDLVIGGSCAAPTSIEIGGTWQFLDDKSFADDGNPEADDWLQFDAGVRFTRAVACARRSVLRFGATVVRAEGVPNIVQEEGTYFGGYVGVGFETDLSDEISIGPELTVHAVTKDGSFTHGIVPQFTWRMSWWIGGTPSGGDPCRAPGEAYASAAALLWPGLGGGVESGQRVHRDRRLDLSFEVLAGLERLDDGVLGADGEGEGAYLRGSLKALLSPSSRSHWTARVGVGWFRNTAEVDGIDSAGDYVGACVGFGYEFDLTRCLRTGPEVGAWVVAREGTADVELLPQLTWRLTFLL